MQELIAVLSIDEYLLSQTTFSSTVGLLNLADEGVTKSTILFEVATQSSICVLSLVPGTLQALLILNATTNHAVKVLILQP